MLITKNELRTIIKEELVRTMIIREVRQYRKTHGRIDEGFMTDLAKKYGLQKKAIAAILAASVAAGAFAPATAAAQDLVQRGPDTEQQAPAEKDFDASKHVSDMAATNPLYLAMELVAKSSETSDLAQKVKSKTASGEEINAWRQSVETKKQEINDAGGVKAYQQAHSVSSP